MTENSCFRAKKGRVGRVNFNLYHYAGNNPVKYTDPDGRLMKKSNGEFVSEKTDEYRDNIDQNTQKITGKSQMYYLYADDGTKIKAYKNLSDDKGFDTDCHGFTLTDGAFWIDNIEAEKAFRGDNYKEIPNENAKEGDIVIWKKDGVVKHSAKVSAVVKFKNETKISTYGLGGTEKYPDYRLSTDSKLAEFGEPHVYRKIGNED